MAVSCTGTLHTDDEGYPFCLDGEWVAANFFQMFESLLVTPTPEEIQHAFMAGFSLPLIAYLTAWAYQAVIDFASRDRIK